MVLQSHRSLVGWEEGSAIATLELGPQPQQMDMFGCVGEESLKAFLTGMEVITANAGTETKLPPGYDSGVLEAVEALGKVFEHGIDAISFSSDRNSFPASMAYTKTIRERVRAGMGRPADSGHAVKVGRLEVLNGHGVLRGNFWEVNGTRWNCLFKSEHLDALPEAWMKNVKITGKIIEGEHLIEVETMLVIEDDMMQTDTQTEARSFWQSVSLDELAEEQGIGVSADLDSISAAWPADDDPDALLAFVLHERGVRRKTAEQIT